MRHRIPGTWLVALAVSALRPFGTWAQEGHQFVVAGYGTASFEAVITDESTSDFIASLSPVLLYSAGTDFLFEAELEFGLNGTATTTTLEYAQLDYLGLDRFQFIFGKFLLPFGVFGERLHPSWINKLPTAPPLFGHAHGGVAEDALLPILSDAGLMVRFNQPLSGSWHLDVSGYVTQGPQMGSDVDDHADDAAHARLGNPGILPVARAVGDHAAAADVPAPPVAFGTAFGDNNQNKMLGARVGVVKGPSFEVYVSGFHAMYDAEDFLDFVGTALSVEWRRGGFEVRGEGVLTWQEFVGETDFETLDQSGFYLQTSRRFDKWEPVARWSFLGDGTVDGATVSDSHSEVAIGLDYWFRPTVPLKVAWEIHEDRDDRVIVQWAFGF
ncbi:MAG TPA: hypothetical protein VK858_17900 [Longimicrobiales bacterium]|nr:hypothetical protein [Longimicrobiales bacterium]